VAGTEADSKMAAATHAAEEGEGATTAVGIEIGILIGLIRRLTARVSTGGRLVLRLLKEEK
jgi:hypothetical protein